MNEWNDLSVAERIDRSSAVALVRFEKKDEGLMSAYVENILKKESLVELPVNIGDRLENSDYYSQGGYQRDRNGILIYFEGSPGKERSKSYLYEDRIASSGDMPLEIFFKEIQTS